MDYFIIIGAVIVLMVFISNKILTGPIIGFPCCKCSKFDNCNECDCNDDNNENNNENKICNIIEGDKNNN